MTPTHDSPERLTPAQWREQARLAARDQRPDLVPYCLEQAAAIEAEGDRTPAEMLMSSEGATT